MFDPIFKVQRSAPGLLAIHLLIPSPDFNMSAPQLVNSKPGRKAQAVRTVGGSSIDALVFDEVQVPEPGPCQVLVAIQAVSLNFRDLAVVTGRYPRRVSG